MHIVRSKHNAFLTHTQPENPCYRLGKEKMSRLLPHVPGVDPDVVSFGVLAAAVAAFQEGNAVIRDCSIIVMTLMAASKIYDAVVG